MSNDSEVHQKVERPACGTNRCSALHSLENKLFVPARIGRLLAPVLHLRPTHLHLVDGDDAVRVRQVLDGEVSSIEDFQV